MQQLARRFTNPPRFGNRGLDYLLARPVDHPQGAERWPFLLFLHGRGERGRDLALVKQHGLAKELTQMADFPCVVASPQCPPETEWADHLDLLAGVVDEMVAEQRVDPARIYYTGLSMGGRGCWRLALADPTRPAAMAVICGRYDGDWDRLSDLAAIPIRIFHGALDPVVPLAESQRIYDHLQAAGADVKLTVYPHADHNSWDAAYGDPDLYAWLLQQRTTV